MDFQFVVTFSSVVVAVFFHVAPGTMAAFRSFFLLSTDEISMKSRDDDVPLRSFNKTRVGKISSRIRPMDRNRAFRDAILRSIASSDPGRLFCAGPRSSRIAFFYFSVEKTNFLVPKLRALPHPPLPLTGRLVGNGAERKRDEKSSL